VKTHGLVKWLRSQFRERNHPAGPAVITRREPRPVSKPAPKSGP
jgi:hypothetical protein